ncbi:MAG: hypothetical protein KBE22_05230 [Candidatus Accumulibacter sp.]|nr:hypothetical protein [Accumulibacter sp.]
MVFDPYSYAVSRLFGGKSGRSKSRPGRVQSEWDRISLQPGQFDSSGGPPTDLADSGIYDEFGFTRGLPGSHIAPDVQYGAEQVVTRRNDQLMAMGGQQAAAALTSGVENVQRYRPGGAAAMLSGYYQGLANTYLTTASARRTETPNLMFRYDEKVRKSAEEAAQKAGLISAGSSLIGGVLGMLIPGAGLAGPAAAVGGAVGGAMAGMQASNTTGYSAPIGPPQAPGAQGGGIQQQGGGQQAQGGAGAPQAGLPIGPPLGPQGAPAGGPQGPKTAPGRGAPGGPSGGMQGPPQAGDGGQGGQKQMAGGGLSYLPPTGFPSPGPATSTLASRMGHDPAYLSAMMQQIGGTDTRWVAPFQARLNLLLQQDAMFRSRLVG